MIFEHSRYTYCESWFDEDGRLFLDARKPFRYVVLKDNVVHTVQQGETVFTIAGQHFRPHARAAGLWWIVADFQPNPIHDPTIRLPPGSVLILPSLETVYSRIFNEARRKESRL